MALTTTQKQTLAAYITSVPAWASMAKNSDTAYYIASQLNLDSSPTFYVWRSQTSASDIMDAITWANLTPADSPSGTATFTNQALVAQAKQLNLQILLQGREQVATGKVSVRGGLSDALQNVPTGVGGALLDAGWAGAGKVKAAITRVASVVEKLFATGTGTTAVPGSLVVEGPISYQDVESTWS